MAAKIGRSTEDATSPDEKKMISERLSEFYNELPSDVKLVAVSKFQPLEKIRQAYLAGQRVFGESRPQEFAMKAVQLDQDIEWHFIGHLQTNKLNLVLTYCTLVESVDSLRLLQAIDNWGLRKNKVISVLLELHLGEEPSKQGFSDSEIREIMSDKDNYPNIRFCGLMGMASNTDEQEKIEKEFAYIESLKNSLASEHEGFSELSIGMSGDWKYAIKYGATIVRIGTAIFGSRY